MLNIDHEMEKLLLEVSRAQRAAAEKLGIDLKAAQK